MKAIFYYNTSEAIKVDKDLEYIAELDIVLKTSVSIKNPIIDLELKYGNNDIVYGVVDSDGDDVIINADEELIVDAPYSITDFNYVYIPVLERYYYINNTILITPELFRFELSEDVLMSFKTQYKELDAFVTRNEFTYNALVKDDLISYYYDKEVTESQMPTGDKVNVNLQSVLSQTSYNYMISVVNKVHTAISETITPPSIYLPQVQSVKIGNSATAFNYVTSLVEVRQLCKDLIDDDVPSSYLISIVAYPFEFTHYNMSDFNLWLGDTEYNDVKVNRPTNQLSDYFVVGDFTFNGDTGTFLDYEPYTEYELYIPYLSWVKISADLLLGNRILIYYVLNYQDATAQVNIFDMTHNRIIHTATCQLGVKIPINTSNAREVADTRNSNNIGLSVGLLTSLLSVGGGIATNNPIATASGLISGGKTIASYIQNMNTNYQKATGNITTGQSGLYLAQYVKLRRTSYKPKDYNSDYFKLYGRPLNKVVKLNTLSGFTQIDDIHLENIKAFENEKDELYDLLKSGIIL